MRSFDWKADRVKNAFVGFALFLFALLVYSVSPVRYLNDSAYSILMDQAILEHGTPDMRHYHRVGRDFHSTATAIGTRSTS